MKVTGFFVGTFLLLTALFMIHSAQHKEKHLAVAYRLIELVRKGERDALPVRNLPHYPTGYSVPLVGKAEAVGIELTRGQGLSGRMLSKSGVLRIRELKGLGEGESLHGVEVVFSSSSGGNLAIAFTDARQSDNQDFLHREDALSWSLVTPVIPDGRVHSYWLEAKRPIRLSPGLDLLLRPIDVRGAQFEVKAVRLISRNDYLESLPNGVGWYGLNEIYHESLVLRPSVDTSVEVLIPAGGRLEVSIGTIDSEQVIFQVKSKRLDIDGLERTMTRAVNRPKQWTPWSIDLSKDAGHKVRISFSVASRSGRATGFWGKPIIRGFREPLRGDGSAKRPHGVIIIWVDSLRKDHLKSYGYERETAPAISRMANEGTVFTDCISQGSWTKVSTSSLLSSLYPFSHGVLDFSDKLPSSVVTLPEIFQEAGYSTVSFSSILLTGRFSNLHQGFDEVVESLSFPDKDSSKTSQVYVPMAIKWLEAHRDAPFFMFLHLYDPHDPYRPSSPYDNVWAEASAVGEFEKATRRVEGRISDPLLRRFSKPTAAELLSVGSEVNEYAKVPKDWYDASVLAMDAEIGKLFEALDQLQMDRGTLVVIASDHGEEFFEHGRMFHGQSVYRELIEVPLILRWPGVVSSDVRVDATTELVDVMPTILDLSGLPIPAGVQGRSLAGFIRLGGKPDRVDRRPAFALKARVEEVLSPPPRKTESYAVITEGWKLIHNKIREEGAVEFELYDRRRDPFEQMNLSGERPETVERLVRQLDSWRRFTLRHRIEEDSPETILMQGENLRRLVNLGYLNAPGR